MGCYGYNCVATMSHVGYTEEGHKPRASMGATRWVEEGLWEQNAGSNSVV